MFMICLMVLCQAFIVLSCLISVSVNFSTFLVIGKTSPVTYQVLGHLKTCLVLAFGYVLLHDPFSWRNIFGILIALVGMVLYSYYCSAESAQKASEVTSQSSQVLSTFPIRQNVVWCWMSKLFYFSVFVNCKERILLVYICKTYTFISVFIAGKRYWIGSFN